MVSTFQVICYFRLIQAIIGWYDSSYKQNKVTKWDKFTTGIVNMPMKYIVVILSKSGQSIKAIGTHVTNGTSIIMVWYMNKYR